MTFATKVALGDTDVKHTPSLDALACVNTECKDYAQPARNNLTVCKTEI